MCPLSLKERDRRWKLIREQMEKRGLSALVVSGMGGVHSRFEKWVTDDEHIPFLIFPLEGEPTCLIMLTQRQYAREKEYPSWCSDYRLSPIYSGGIIARLRELGLEKGGKVGVVGVEPCSMDTEGSIPYKTWSQVLQALPKVSFEDATWWMTEISLPKSEEELRFVEKAAEIAEKACRAILTIIKPGVGEDDLYRVVEEVVLREKGTMPLSLWGSGPTTLRQQPPDWLFGDTKPRIFRAGDILSTEFGPFYARYTAQVQFCVALSPVDRLHEKCSDVTQEVLKEVEKAIRPGVTFGKVAEAAEKPLREAGAYYISPQMHSMNPQILRSTHSMDYRTGRAVDTRAPVSGEASAKYLTFVRGADIVLKKGMILELEPNACFEDHRVLIGGTVVVEDTGPRRLNELAFKMQKV